MPEDAPVIKERIISLFKVRGPSLPVHVAKETGLSILFSSAFLSELMSEKRVKQSSMRVGSSPIYFIPGQEPMLERFADFLKSKEKEAFLLLKERKFLKDSEQQPAIRVALRAINDFAIPFKREEEIYWRYFVVPETDFKPVEPIKKVEKEVLKFSSFPQRTPEKEISEKIAEAPVSKQINDNMNIFDKKAKEKPIVSSSAKSKKPKPKTKSNQNEKFLERVKEFLSNSSVEILSIEGLKKDELALKIKRDGEEQLLIAYNKKKITEKDIIKAAKKASDSNLKYSVLSLGEMPKSVSDLIEALKNIKDIGKVE